MFNKDKKTVGCAENPDIDGQECDKTFAAVITNPCTTFTN